ncbi:MAG: hypothetical protein MK066_01230 [Crocinitomicaceae bacterium]|nr:hypothetical protein [Crocinitomicaceae bacterium]
MPIPFISRRHNKDLLDQCKGQLEQIRVKSEILAICPQTTGYNWLGVNIATKSLFPKATFEIPQSYSNSILTDSELNSLCKTINELDFKQVIFSGFPRYFFNISGSLNSNISQKVIFHGFLAEFAGNVEQQGIFTEIINCCQKGIITSLGFVKKGLGLSTQQRFSIPCFEIILPNNTIKEEVPELSSDINIGCLVNNSFRKNIHNQAMAASMIENATIHLFNNEELDYLKIPKKKMYELMEHRVFFDLIGSMSLNMHVTFSEGMGGQVCAESISQGVPCISGNTSSFFDYNEDLKSQLVVCGADDSWQIFMKIEDILANHSAISKECILYAKLLNVLSEERTAKFLDS